MVFIWFRKVENEIKDCESAKVVFMSNLSRRLYWYSDEHVYGIERGWNGGFARHRLIVRICHQSSIWYSVGSHLQVSPLALLSD
jgi:hypothetical protein